MSHAEPSAIKPLASLFNRTKESEKKRADPIKRWKRPGALGRAAAALSEWDAPAGGRSKRRLYIRFTSSFFCLLLAAPQFQHFKEVGFHGRIRVLSLPICGGGVEGGVFAFSQSRMLASRRVKRAHGGGRRSRAHRLATGFEWVTQRPGEEVVLT